VSRSRRGAHYGEFNHWWDLVFTAWYMKWLMLAFVWAIYITSPGLLSPMRPYSFGFDSIGLFLGALNAFRSVFGSCIWQSTRWVKMTGHASCLRELCHDIINYETRELREARAQLSGLADDHATSSTEKEHPLEDMTHLISIDSPTFGWSMETALLDGLRVFELTTTSGERRAIKHLPASVTTFGLRVADHALAEANIPLVLMKLLAGTLTPSSGKCCIMDASSKRMAKRMLATNVSWTAKPIL